MIKSFKCRDTERLFNDIEVSRFKAISRIARRKLEMLNAAISLQSLRVPPGNRLEQLKGNRRGQFSIRINDFCGKFAFTDNHLAPFAHVPVPVNLFSAPFGTILPASCHQHRQQDKNQAKPLHRL